MYTVTEDIADLDAGSDNHVPIKFPPRGTLRRLIVTQLDGDADGFELDLYSSREPLDAAADDIDLEDLPDANYKVLPTQTVAGPAKVLELLDINYDYMNQDGDAVNVQQYLYLRIRPAAGAEPATKSFRVTLGQEMPME